MPGSWNETLDRFAAAQRDFARGEAAAMKRLWANTDDVTIFGAFGGHERGWANVGPRIDWAASHFADGVLLERDYIAAAAGGELAYTVNLDRMRARLGAAKEERLVEVRVTQVWRREGGEWRIVHRHGDPLLWRSGPA